MTDFSGASTSNPAQSYGNTDPSRDARLDHVRGLLANLARHLSASDTRYSDILAQLQDRLGELGQWVSAGQTGPDTDRQLALFEAQLESLASRAGVTLGHAVESTPPPRRSVHQELPASGDIFSPAPAGVHAPVIHAVGVPAPDLPAASPVPDALNSSGTLSFEDAVASEQCEPADDAPRDVAPIDCDEAIYTYHPTTGTPVAASNFDAADPPEAVDNASPLPPAADAWENQEFSALIDDDSSALIGAGPVDETRDTDRDAEDGSQEVPVMQPTEWWAEDAPADSSEPPVDAARSDVLATDIPYNPISVPDDTYSTEVGQPEVHPIIIEEHGDVFQQIAGLSEKVDRVAVGIGRLDGLEESVERLASQFGEVRAEFPKIIESTAEKAAMAAAEQCVGAGPDGVHRLDHLQSLIEGYVRDARTVRGMTTNIGPVPANVPDPMRVEGSTKARLRDRLGTLGPIGSAIAKHASKLGASKSNGGGEPPDPSPSSVMDAGPDLADHGAPVETPPVEHDTVAPAPLQEPLGPPTEEPLASPLPRERLAEQSIRSLRKTLFGNLEDGSPPALIIAICALTAAAGALIYGNLARDGDAERRNMVVASRTAPASGAGEKAPQDSETPRSGRVKSSDRKAGSGATHVAAAESPPDQAGSGQSGRSGANPEEPVTGSTVTRDQATIEPTALTPREDITANQTPAGSSKTLDLPPLTAGPLSLRLAAANGDPVAQFEIGSRLAQGNGVTRDPVAAAKWYTRAASAGHARAQYRLAALYERGTGVATDVGRAKIWYTRAAQQGNVKAMHNLAVLYAGQAGGTPNYVSAVQWFEKAAAHDLADSQFNVAILFANGLGTSRDLKAAYKWFALAARQGDREAVRRLRIVEGKLKPAQLAAAKRLVANWRPEPISDVANKPVAWRPPSPAQETSTARTAPSQPGPKTSAKATAPAGIGPDEILLAQRLLGKLGLDPGKPDGRLGTQTHRAVKAFQSRNGMIPTGEIDAALLKRLQTEARVNLL